MRTRKVVVYYFLAIVLPCVILGILAFRGIRNDQALIERENRIKVQETAHDIVSMLDNKLDSIEKLLQDFEYIITDEAVFHNHDLDSILTNLPEVAGCVVFSSDNKVSLLDKNLAYLPVKSNPSTHGLIPKMAR